MLLALDAMVLLAPVHQRPGRVLMMRMDALGDFILWLDAARALRQIYPTPSFRVTLVVKNSWATLAREIGWWDEVRPLDTRAFYWNLRYRLQFLLRVRRDGYEIAIRPQVTHDGFYGESMIRVCGAPTRVGHEGDRGRLSPSEYRRVLGWYTERVPDSDADGHELARNAGMVRHLGRPQYVPSLPDLPRLSNCHSVVAGNTDYFVVVPGAQGAGRRWPAARFAEIIGRIQQRTGWLAVLLGSPGERPITEAILRMADGCAVADAVGRTSVPELVETIRGARCVICNETGAIHVAAATETPAFAILGGGHFGRFMPYDVKVADDRPLPFPVYGRMGCFGCDWKCIYERQSTEQPYPCVENMTVDGVWRAVERWLGQTVDGLSTRRAVE